jgi:hypothetical protein
VNILMGRGGYPNGGCSGLSILMGVLHTHSQKGQVSTFAKRKVDCYILQRHRTRYFRGFGLINNLKFFYFHQSQIFFAWKIKSLGSA